MIALTYPTLRYASTNASEFDACMDWVATLWMYDGSDDRHAVGYCEFLTIKLGQENIALGCLDQFDDDAFSFAPLFDGTELCVDVANEYWARESVDTLILKAVQVAQPLRGHQLGAWILAEVIARFAHPYTFVAGLAGSMEHDDSATDAECESAAQRLADYWTTTTGLSRVKSRQASIGSGVLLGANPVQPEVFRARQALTEAIKRRVITVNHAFEFAVPDIGGW